MQPPLAGDASQNHPVPLNTNVRAYVRASEQWGLDSNEDHELLSEIPTSHEILNGLPSENFNITNNITEPWSDNLTYLRTHYKLLREDSVRPLREAVLKFRKDPMMNDDQNVTIYDKVGILPTYQVHTTQSADFPFRSISSALRLLTRALPFEFVSPLAELERRSCGSTPSDLFPGVWSP